jgi:hypothetical protein
MGYLFDVTVNFSILCGCEVPKPSLGEFPMQKNRTIVLLKLFFCKNVLKPAQSSPTSIKRGLYGLTTFGGFIAPTRHVTPHYCQVKSRTKSTG